MKVLRVLIFGALFFCAAHVKAQTLEQFKAMPPQQRAALFADTLKTVLKLNAEQYGKIYSIALDVAQKSVPVMKNDESKFSKAQEMKILFDSAEIKMKTVLTAGQFVLYQTKKQEVIAYYRGRYRGK